MKCDGLLSAHLLYKKTGMELEPGWPCSGPLLRLAEDVARGILPGNFIISDFHYDNIILMNFICHIKLFLWLDNFCSC